MLRKRERNTHKNIYKVKHMYEIGTRRARERKKKQREGERTIQRQRKVRKNI